MRARLFVVASMLGLVAVTGQTLVARGDGPATARVLAAAPSSQERAMHSELDRILRPPSLGHRGPIPPPPRPLGRPGEPCYVRSFPCVRGRRCFVVERCDPRPCLRFVRAADRRDSGRCARRPPLVRGP